MFISFDIDYDRMFKFYLCKRIEKIYKNTVKFSRLEKVRESLLLNQTELEVAENFGVNVDHLLNRREENEKDDFYSQKDEDREDEGLDDADQDGDYKEN